MMPMRLVDLPSGQSAVVVEVHAKDALRTRLVEFGIRPGVVVMSRQRCSGGGRMVQVGNARLALDRAALTMIDVEIHQVAAGRGVAL
jgi:Fe2+ transport system protein FeoA